MARKRDDIFFYAVKKMDEALSKDYVQFSIEFDGIVFDFSPAIDVKENLQYKGKRKDLISRMLNDVAHQLIKDSIKNYYDNGDGSSTGWDRFDAIVNSVPTKQQIASPISKEEYEEVKVEAKKSAPLDYSSYQVKQETTPEIITHNCGCGQSDNRDIKTRF